MSVVYNGDFQKLTYDENLNVQTLPLGSCYALHTGLTNQFGTMALSLSGGGFRACAFHLGVLKSLHERNLLKYVSTISAVSGGSITALFYANAIEENISFDQFYEKFYKFIATAQLDFFVFLKKIISPKRYGIQILAAEYRKRLFHGKSIKRNEIKKIKLYITCTDLTNNRGFTFNLNDGFSYGWDTKHGFCRVRFEVLNNLDVSDVLAISSAHPILVSPIKINVRQIGDLECYGGMPRKDFWPESPTLYLGDGGIVDNSGFLTAISIFNYYGGFETYYLISDASKPPLGKNIGRNILSRINTIYESSNVQGSSLVKLSKNFFPKPGYYCLIPVDIDEFPYGCALEKAGINWSQKNSFNHLKAQEIAKKVIQYTLCQRSIAMETTTRLHKLSKIQLKNIIEHGYDCCNMSLGRNFYTQFIGHDPVDPIRSICDSEYIADFLSVDSE